MLGSTMLDVAIGIVFVLLSTVCSAIRGGIEAMALHKIKTGQRRIIEFLLSPLSRRLQEAGRER